MEVTPRFLIINTSSKSVVSFKLRLLYPRKESLFWYLLRRKLGWSHSRSVGGGEEANLMFLCKIEPRLHGRPAPSLGTTTIHQDTQILFLHHFTIFHFV
jgi:hypothetical protein